MKLRVYADTSVFIAYFDDRAAIASRLFIALNRICVHP